MALLDETDIEILHSLQKDAKRISLYIFQKKEGE